jgi:hypothetical protein
MPRLAGQIRAGQLAAWPKLKFVSNRLAIEKVIEEAREATRPAEQPLPTPLPTESRLRGVLSEDDLQGLLAKARDNNGVVEVPEQLLTPNTEREQPTFTRPMPQRQDSPSFTKRMSTFWGNLQAPTPRTSQETVRPSMKELQSSTPSTPRRRRGSGVVDELVRQSRVFFDDFDDSEAQSDNSVRRDGEETEEEEMSDSAP